MASIDKLPSGSFRAQIRKKGIATLRKTFATKAEAETWAHEKEMELVASFAGKRKNDKSISELIELYFNSTTFEDKAEATQRREKNASKAVIKHLGSFNSKYIWVNWPCIHRNL